MIPHINTSLKLKTAHTLCTKYNKASGRVLFSSHVALFNYSNEVLKHMPVESWCVAFAAGSETTVTTRG